MRNYLGYALVIGILFSGCGTDTSTDECKYKIGDKCVKAVEKEIFDILTEKTYYTHKEYYGDVDNTSYSKINFTEEHIEQITYPEALNGKKGQSLFYPWGIEENVVIIAALDAYPQKFTIKKEENSIQFYHRGYDNYCRIWDNRVMANKNKPCLFGINLSL